MFESCLFYLVVIVTFSQLRIWYPVTVMDGLKCKCLKFI